MNEKNNIFLPEFGYVRAEHFSAVYPEINHWLLSKKEFMPSRDGDVKETMDFKTTLTNPYNRCVGGYGRNINIFFLFAEAMWIALGRKDVEFLTIFNSGMAKYSDNGEVFHAPYGHRLRNWGVRSEDKFTEDNLSNSKGQDQVIDAIRILSQNPSTRQVVMSIWNPAFDLGAASKDIPCNDLVMLKIRDGKLITTIANRSNDLHLGLPTNIFQFSFLTELMSLALGIKLGTQTHNSQSLHVYSWSKPAERMEQAWLDFNHSKELYNGFETHSVPIDFKFETELAVSRFREIEYALRIIVDNLLRVNAGEVDNNIEIQHLKSVSNYLFAVYRLLRLYVIYKQEREDASEAELQEIWTRYFNSVQSIEESMSGELGSGIDFMMLAKNWFASKMEGFGLIGTL